MMIQAKIIKDIVKNKGSFNIVTQGNSMFPTIKSGEKVSIINPENLVVGDIILFEICNELVLHRIVEINEPYYVTQGDNHLYSDHYICKEQIIGKMDEKRNYQEIKQYDFKFKGLTFVYWNLELISDKLMLQLASYGIEVKKEMLLPDKINIAIIPGAEKNINDLKMLIDKHEAINLAIHFNANISNSPREGYLELSKFDGYFRIGSRISNFLLNGEESMLLILGSLL